MATEKRLYDLCVLVEELYRNDEYVGSNEWETHEIVEFLERLTPVDAVEVVHGRWMREGAQCVCSACYESLWNETNYCPNCGAKMDGDGNA